MSMTASRCIAIAAHGRRCQQSRHKGSPYCWHHMQSPKVPAPSRLRTLSRVPARPSAGPPVELAAVAAAARSAEVDLGVRLVRALGRGTAAAVLNAIEGSDEGTMTLIRHAGGVAVWQSPTRAARHARA